MNQAVATCWTCLLLSAFFLCEPVLSKGGGRGGARGSSRGTSRMGQTGGQHRGGGTTRSRFRGPGRSSASRVAGAAAAGAVVALSADGWYASAYRRSNAGVADDDDMDYYNRTSYYESLMSSGSAQNLSSLTHIISVIVATFSPKMGSLLDSIL